MAFVTNVESDQQGRDLLYDAGILKFAAIDGTDSRNLRRKFAGELRSIRIIAAHHDVTVQGRIAVEQIGRQIVECGDHTYSLGHEFSGLLRRRPLPNA